MLGFAYDEHLDQLVTLWPHYYY